MKTTGLPLKTLTLLTIMGLMNISLAGPATDVFPLDLWEEMTDWQL